MLGAGGVIRYPNSKKTFFYFSLKKDTVMPGTAIHAILKLSAT
jgi:hypothetical protein